MNTRERQIQRAVWALIAIAAVVVVARSLPHGADLASRSTRIADARTWECDYPGYFWENDHTILAVSGSALAFMRVDLNTGTATPLTEFSKRVAQTQSSTETWRLSPDSKWLLVQSRLAHRVTAIALDGSKVQSWQVAATAMRYIHWLPNSTEWVELRQPAKRPITPAIHSLSGQYRLARLIEGPCDFPISTSADGRLINAEQYGDHVDITQYDLTPKGAAPLTTTLAFDGGFGAFEAEASHKGDRIAFLTHTRGHRSPLSFFGFLFPSLRDNGERTLLWQGNTNGSGLHVVGVEHTFSVAGLQWTPDDSHLSYFIGNSLYTIPAK